MKKSLLVVATLCLSGLSCDMVEGMNASGYERRLAQNAQQVLNNVIQAHKEGDDDRVNVVIISTESDNLGILCNLLWLAVKNDHVWLAEEIFGQYGSQIKVDEWRDSEGRTLLMQSVINDNIDMLLSLIEMGASIFNANGQPVFDKKDRGVIYYAVIKGGKILDLLHLNGVDFNAHCKRSHSDTYLKPFMVAYQENKEVFEKMLSWEGIVEQGFIDFPLLQEVIEKGDLDLFKRLIDLRDCNSTIKDIGLLLLRRAICAKKLDFIKYLVDKGVDVNATDSSGDGVLHYAASSNGSILNYFLNIPGVLKNINQQGDYGFTPLHEAIVRLNLECVKILCQQLGINFNIKDRFEQTALNYAVMKSFWSEYYGEIPVKMIYCIIDAKINLGINVDEDVNNWLYKIREEGYDNSNVVKDLVKRFGASILEGNKHLLYNAIIYSEPDQVFFDYLVQYYRKADEAERGKVLCLAARNSAVLRYLFENSVVGKSDVNMYDSDGWTPLHSAALHGKVESVQILCQQSGIDFNKRDDDGRTALDIAKEKGYAEITQIITEAIARQKQAKTSE